MSKKEEKPYFLLEISKEDEIFYIYAKGSYKTSWDGKKMQKIISDSANNTDGVDLIIPSILKEYDNALCNLKLIGDDIDPILEDVLSTSIGDYNKRLLKHFID